MGETSAQRLLPFRLLTIAALLILGLVLIELALELYVFKIEKYGRIFRNDPELGWTFLPEIAVERIEGPGPYLVATDQEGHRISPGEKGSPVARWRESEATRKILIVGDSQAAGRGVDVEYRVDRVLNAQHPDWSVLAVGVGGFGTCQELILARRYLGYLNRNDVMVLLTSANDFTDLLDPRPTRRARPRCALENGRVSVHPPEIGLRERLRDRFYLGYLVFGRILSDSKRTFSEEEIAYSRILYEAIVRTMADEVAERGAITMIAHSTDRARGNMSDVYARLDAEPGISVLALDPHLIGDGLEGNENLLRDNVHWSRKGHALVAGLLERSLNQIAAEVSAGLDPGEAAASVGLTSGRVGPRARP